MALQTPIGSGRLLERERELDALRQALTRSAQGSGTLIMVEGPAGVGKTALLEAARAAAEEAGLLVLRARGAELERSFGFGVVRQLFDEVVRDPEPALFTGAARFAAPLLEVELDVSPTDDPFAMRHSLYWLTANLAAERPLAVLVDDAHWADAASLGVLAHIANRLDGIPVALIVASRTDESPAELESLAATVLALQPLGEQASAVIVRALAPNADDALCRACHGATGGNPFLLHELARSLADGAVDVAAQSPERVTREIAARLAGLPEAVRSLARAAAVLGGGVSLRQAAALAGIYVGAATDAASALVAAEVLRSNHPLEFLHPLIGAAVYAGMDPALRSREHARAARVLAEDGESPERVAAQLLRCPPAGDRWVFERLLAAALLAAARGATDAQATYLQRALDEPAPPERRAEILLTLGAAQSHFDPVTAVAHLRDALAAEIEVERRFQATMLLAGVLGQTGRVAEAADLLEEQFEAFAGRADLYGQMEAALANITRIDPATRHRARDVIERMRRRVAEGERDPAVLGTIAAEMGMAGEPADRMAELAERVVAGGEGTATTAAGWSWYNAVRSLVVGERYELALHVLEAALAQARERAQLIDVAGALTFRCELYTHTGDLASAEVDARTLHEIAVGYGSPLALGMAAATLGEVLIERGELAEAEQVLFKDAFAGPPAALPQVYMNIWVLRVRGLLRIAQGRLEEAVEELRESGRRALAIDHVSPAVLDWRSQLALVLLELGETSEARWLATEELGRAHAMGARRALGIALRVHARVSGGDEELRQLREATAILDGSEAQLERARAHADLGAALRRAGDAEAARSSLRRAIDLAHRCSARVLEDQALSELRATGARPRRRLTTGAGALTPSERRIAELAAGGQQNREIAETLFVTTATVEYHLRNAYRKLGIASRTQLHEALAPESV